LTLNPFIAPRAFAAYKASQCTSDNSAIIVGDLGHRNVWLMTVSDGDRELYSQWRFQRVDKSASDAATVVDCDLYPPYEIN